MRKNITTNSPSEVKVGYSRAVRINNTIYFSGTTAQDETGMTQGINVYEQTKYIFEKIKKILKQENFSLKDIVKLNVYLIEMKELAQFDQAFKEYFNASKPACTLVGVNKLVKGDLLIEIECLAEKVN